MNHGKLSGSLNHIEVRSNQSLICDILLNDNILLLFALLIVKVYKLIINKLLWSEIGKKL